MNKKRRNHYVWKHYLRPWSVRHKIWCLIKNEMIEKRLDDIAVEKDFYKRRPPTKNDIVKLEYMISKMRVPFQELGKEWLTLFQTHDLVKNLIEENKTLSNLIKENKTLPISPFSPNFIEEIHTKIEKNGKKYLDLILKENLSFLDSPNDFYEFISFFSAQLFRTKKYRDALLENSNDLENIWGISSLILSTNLSNSIMIREFKVILCKNTTTVKFITTDYPIINISAKLNKIPEEGKHTFYYPVSPNLAILVGKTDNIGKKNCKDLTEKKLRLTII